VLGDIGKCKKWLATAMQRRIHCHKLHMVSGYLIFGAQILEQQSKNVMRLAALGIIAQFAFQ
jgi:hypothetical protein